MGKAFSAVTREYLDQEGTSMERLAGFAGLTFTAATNWKSGKALPERASALQLRDALPSDWSARFWEAWLEDSSPPEVWAAYRTNADGAQRDGLDDAFALARAVLGEEDRKRLTLLLGVVRRVPAVLPAILTTAGVIESAAAPPKTG